MLVDSYILPECIALPGSFGGLMVLYEANFIKLGQLVQGLEENTNHGVSRTCSDFDLHFSVKERTKYTCQFRLTYYFDDEGERTPEPDLFAKAYFDARMVEVQGWKATHRHEILRSLGAQYGRPLDVCWSRNIMLSKWLDFLLDQGHGFTSEVP